MCVCPIRSQLTTIGKRKEASKLEQLPILRDNDARPYFLIDDFDKVTDRVEYESSLGVEKIADLCTYR